MNSKTRDQDDAIGTEAASRLRYVHWWLAFFVSFLSVAIYFESVTLGYVYYSVVVGVVGFALTLLTWRRRSRILPTVTFVLIFQAHYWVCISQPPHRPAVSGMLISGVTLFCLLQLARPRIRRFCNLPE